MYSSKPMSALIADFKSQNKAKPRSKEQYRKRLKVLASRLTNWSLAIKRCSFTLNEIFYCYAYLDPRKPGNFTYTTPAGKVLKFAHQPFYIGKGKAGRVDVHLKIAKARGSRIGSHKICTIKAIWDAGLDPIRVVTASRVSEALALACEIDLIAGIGRFNLNLGPLHNLTDGGEGNSEPRTAEWNAKNRAAKLGKKHSEAHKAAMRGPRPKTQGVPKTGNAAKGVPKPGVSLRLKGIPKTAEANRKNREAQQKLNTSLPDVSCPHCGRTGKFRYIGRFHFNQCPSR